MIKYPKITDISLVADISK